MNTDQHGNKRNRSVFIRLYPWRSLSVGGHAWLLGVLTVALALRLIGLRYGLPAVYNPDEVAIMSRAAVCGSSSACLKIGRAHV